MIYLALFIAAIIVFVFYRRTLPELQTNKRYLLLTLRFISISIVLILLFNPVLHFVRSYFEKPTILFLQDNSGSMELTSDGLSKRALLNNSKDSISSEIVSLGYGEESVNFANGLNGEEHSSYLNKTLQELKKEIDLSKVEEIVLLSDGWFYDEDLNAVNDLNLPISVVIPDYKVIDQDLSIESIKFNKTGLQ